MKRQRISEKWLKNGLLSLSNMLAVVLARQDVREYDQIVSFYTQEDGRRDFLVKGVKKIITCYICYFLKVGLYFLI